MPALVSAAFVLVFSGPDLATKAPPVSWAEIRVVDQETGRGVPLVELETVNSLVLVTDNAGRIAFHEPGLLGRQLFFTVKSHGYEFPKDGFGFRGARVTPRAGETATLKIRRVQPAERLCRLTGEGLYRDTVLLGLKAPVADPLNPGQVAGQDSVQTVRFRDQILWLWGDTLRMEYPLGIFRMAGATTLVPDPHSSEGNPENGIPYRYFTDAKGFARNMMPLPERPEGVIWINAPCVVKDDKGADTLVAHYSRRKGLADEIEHGIAVYDPEKAIFTVARQLPLAETWRHPAGHAISMTRDGENWLLFGSPNPNTRVRATLKDVLDPGSYEAFTCAAGEPGEKKPAPMPGPDGAPQWRWQKKLSPTDSATEIRWIREGKVKAEMARFSPADSANPADRVQMHNGTVRWNEYRKKWVLIGCQVMGKPSFLGEVWYAEAEEPTGPFSKAIRVATHDRQTLYNVNHHEFLDRDGGRIIHFEGTYTNEFSGNPWKTPRYNYNQVLFRLDLGAKALEALRK